MGTGLNSQIISTSNYWKFELISGVVLLAIILPLTYLLTKQYDILGPAIANLISITIYNTIRLVFLWRKFKLFPFTIQSVYTILLAGGCYVLCYFLFQGYSWVCRFDRAQPCIYCHFMRATTSWFNISPDIKPVLQTIRKGLTGKKN